MIKKIEKVIFVMENNLIIIWKETEGKTQYKNLIMYKKRYKHRVY